MTTSIVQAAGLLDKPVLTVPEFARVLGIGKNLGYQLVREGKVRHLRAGARILVPSSAVRELLEG